MTKLLVHELPEKTRALMDRLRSILGSVDSEIGSRLLERARIEHRDKPRMVLTGQYSSGKSSLVKALTDGDVSPLIGADIATDTVTEYPWDGSVVLVDTPGVQSGLRTHDELALDAIGTADFILFTITVNLFDDASRDYLRELANTREMFSVMVVVITQAGKQSAAEGVREKAVQDALGTMEFNLPIVEVDSEYYLRSLEGGERATVLRARSGIDTLRSTINQISNDRGELATICQPLHLIQQLCDEAHQLFIVDERSKASLAAFAQQRAAVSQRRHMIEQSLSAAESGFKSKCLVDVRGFVDAVTSLPQDETAGREALEDARVRLAEALDRHATRFAESINALSEAQFDTLGEALAEIEESNRAQLVTRPSGTVGLEGPSEVHTDRRIGTECSGHTRAVNWDKVSAQLKKGREWWGAGGGLKPSSGTKGHQVVTDVGHLFNKKFKPWEAIKIADKIGKVAKWGGVFLQVGTATYEVWRNEREARAAQLESERQHSAFVTEFMGHADKIAADARRQLWAIINPPLDEFVAGIDALQAEILGSDQARDEASSELQAIAAEADRLLAQAQM